MTTTGPSQPSLWDAPGIRRGRAREKAEQGKATAASKRESEIAALVPLAKELAYCMEYVTVADLRVEAVRRGLLTGTEKGRQLSYLGVVMKRSGLVACGYTRSPLDQSHGNLHCKWRAA